MEILLVIGIIIVLVLILGQSILPLMIFALWLMAGFSALCVVFFLAMAVLVIIARPRDASFLEVDKDDAGIGYAFYEIEGQEYHNTFPTDAFLRKVLYHKKQVRVRCLPVGKTTLVFDKVTFWIIGIGLPFFAVLSYVLFNLIGMI